jgi:glutamyl/glutaminyl-tRNA synthetase
MRTPDQKLSKSDGDTSVRDLRAAGWTAAQVLAAARQGLASLTAR